MSLYETIVKRSLIDKGWSGDYKYCAETADGRKFLLRISPPDRAHRVSKCFENMQRVSTLGIPMCQALETGECQEGRYVLLRWIDGVDAESYIPRLPRERQYAYGLDAGRILGKIHTLPAPEEPAPWAARFGAKMDRKISQYLGCDRKYENGNCIVDFLRNNRNLLSDRPQCYQHGDYHIGNMMVDSEGVLTIIDFDRDDHGDPWEEFNRIVWCAQASPAFAAGMVDGYFEGDVPMDFWKLLALYIGSNCLSSLPWAIPYGEKQIKVMCDQAADILQWYDNMQNPIPTWYHFWNV